MPWFSFLLISLFILSNNCFVQAQDKSNFIPIETVILWNSSATGEDSLDQVSFQNALSTIGLSPSAISPDELHKAELHKFMLIILPHASAASLNDKDIEKILSAVEEGANVITDGNSLLMQKLQLQLSDPVQVKAVRDITKPDNILHWADTPSVPIILNTVDKSLQVLYTDSSSGKAVGVIKTLGEGKILALTTLFDPLSGDGYSRFPNLTNEIITELKCGPPFKRVGVDAYFDPGYRWNVPIPELVSIWKKWGIRAVHAAAWNLYTTPPYNYKQLVSEAHKQGILVYAWLEWPYIGTGFWNVHPEWREKNALLQDAKLDFLLLMDLQNPACMKKALGDLTNLLKDDWDGIDIAEFSITGGVALALYGPNEPKYFTGFNDASREGFKSSYGWDPVELFNESSGHYWKKDSVGLDNFYKYRVQVNNMLLRHIVSSLDSVRVKNKRDWEFVFTVLDNSLHPEFDQLLGFDLPNTIKLAKEFHAVLQVEDPASEWVRPPERYDQMANTYKGLTGDIPFAIDINFVPLHPVNQKGFPSEQPTGTELFGQYKIADNACGRVCFYSESSVYQYDWDVLPYAMSYAAKIKKDKGHWVIETPRTVTLQLRNIKKTIYLDGKSWPCYNPEGIIIPKGKHILSFGNSAEKEQGLHLYNISDELISCTETGNWIKLTYESPARCLLTFNKSPKNITLDGTRSKLKVLKDRNKFIILAPSGKHTLIVR